MKNYESEVRERWGNTDAYREHEQKTKNYTKENIDEICKEIESMNTRNSNLKFALFSRIIAAVENGEIVDFFVIRTLSRKFNLDLMK